MADKLDEGELKALLSEEIRSAITYDDSELSKKRARAMEYYRGDMADTPSLPGRSSIVSRDVADTIGWMLPGIIRVFTASDRMGIYEPVKPGDEDFAEQATDYCNHIFWKDNPGYRILWDATHDSLLQGNGIIKHWWDDKEECEYSEHTGLSEEQIFILMNEEGVEIVAQKEGEPQSIFVPDEQGQMVEQPIPTFDIKIKRVTLSGKVKVASVKPEDFLIDRDAVSIEEARFVGHRRDVTRSDLIEMGFDRELVEGLPADHFATLSEEKLSRDEEFRNYNATAHDSMRFVELFECYIKADADGDGIAETIRAYYAGAQGAGELLDWEVWDDDVPFTDIPCEPVPHRWDARSVFEDVEDIQRVKTVLTRQMLDNLYASNLPQREAEEGSIVNMEALTAPKFGQIILRKKGHAPTVPYEVPFVADKALAGLQHFDMVREMRTGVSRSTMALDPEALTNQTATAVQKQQDAAYSQIELIARNQAELGWRRVFKQILKLTIKHQDRPRTIRLRDEWVDMDPRHWNAEMDVTINVGLGTGSRDRDMAMLGQIISIQKEMAETLFKAELPELALAMMPKILQSAKKITESAGIRNPELFWPEMTDENVGQILEAKSQQGQEEVDPKVQEAQAKMQIEVQRLQFEMQKEQARLQAEAEARQQEQQLKSQQMMQEFELKREQLAMEIQLRREQLAEELRFKRELAQEELNLKRELGHANVEVRARSTAPVRMGGDPG